MFTPTSGRQRRADDQRRQPEAVQEPDRVVERVAVAVDGREERDLGDRADAGRERRPDSGNSGGTGGGTPGS
jgi:hypothetical protein